jgi:hypothetical protein
MKTPEDPCRDPASEARDDWEDREPNDGRRRDRDLADAEDHERFMLGLHPVGVTPSPTAAEIDAHLDECVARSERDWKPLPGDPDVFYPQP